LVSVEYRKDANLIEVVHRKARNCITMFSQRKRGGTVPMKQ